MATSPPYDNEFTDPPPMAGDSPEVVMSQRPSSIVLAMAFIGLLVLLAFAQLLRQMIGEWATIDQSAAISEVIRFLGGAALVAVAGLFIWRGHMAALIISATVLAFYACFSGLQLVVEVMHLFFTDPDVVVMGDRLPAQTLLSAAEVALYLSGLTALALPRSRRWVGELGVARVRERTYRRGGLLPNP